MRGITAVVIFLLFILPALLLAMLVWVLLLPAHLVFQAFSRRENRRRARCDGLMITNDVECLARIIEMEQMEEP